MPTSLRTLLFVVFFFLPHIARAADTQPKEQTSLPGWQVFWSRDPEAGNAVADAAVQHDAHPTVRIEHTGEHDWSLAAQDRVSVHPQDLLELSAWVKVQGHGNASLSLVTFNQGGAVVEWLYGQTTAHHDEGWQHLVTRVLVPPNVGMVMPRVTGEGPATAWVEGMGFRVVSSSAALRAKGVPAELRLENPLLRVTLHTQDATLSVLDKRCKRTWNQAALAPTVVLTDAKITPAGIEMTLLHVATSATIQATVTLDPSAPEFEVAIGGSGDLPAPLAFPHPFITGYGTSLIIPMNEGIAYPVGDAAINPMRLIAYGGHGICMAFWGATDAPGPAPAPGISSSTSAIRNPQSHILPPADGGAAQMAILETPDDAAIRLGRWNQQLNVTPEWDAQRGKFGYPRRIRYVFFDRGGYVAMCKRYRAYSLAIGLLKTLDHKRKENANVDLLIGAVNVWCWEKDGLAVVKELRDAGIQRIFWSNQAPPETIRAMNDMGVLTSRYDIYQDVMDPAQFPRLAWTHPDWTTAAWPRDLMLNASGDWVRGWEVEAKPGAGGAGSGGGGMIPCGVLCDREALPYAAKRVNADLKDHPYRCRFIDTTTASPWRECYSPDHPMTRSDSRQWKMKLLDLMSRDYHLVTGSETGHDAAVPFVDYFEGMLSLGPYRVKDAGRNMQQMLDKVPEQVAKFQLGQKYRLPLWELVYHDCVVAQWYWGDYSNKIPGVAGVWDKRDLFNVLYATPPMFMFDQQTWQKYKDRFVRSYKDVCPVARACGYAEMTDHRILTADYNVQRSTFSNGVTVTVNFGDGAYTLENGRSLAAHGFVVEGMAVAP